MNSQFQNKLLQYEVQPPAEVWNKIASSLDETVSLSLSEKLLQFEEIPSENVWNKIASGLNETAKDRTKVVPFFNRRFIKYSGAVAAMVIFAVLISLFINKKNESELANDNFTTNVVKKDSNATTTEVSGNEISKSVSRSLERDHQESSFSKVRPPRTKQVYYESSFSLPENFLPRIVEREPVINSSSIPEEKYMIYSDARGNAIRVPKKIFTAVTCPTENYDCKKRLKALKERFVSAAVTSDFTGILEILKSLQENQ